MRTSASISLALSLIAAAACGGGSGSDDTGDDDTPVPGADSSPSPGIADAAPPLPPPPPLADAAPFVCDQPATYGDVGALAGPAYLIADIDPDGNRLLELGGPIAGGPPGMVAVIQLWEGYGALAGVKLETVTLPLTVPIAGAEADLNTCGVCGLVIDTRDPATPVFYGATGGTITITALNPTVGTGTVQGSAAGLQLVHLEPDFTPSAATCDSAVASLTFDVTVEAEPAGP